MNDFEKNTICSNPLEIEGGGIVLDNTGSTCYVNPHDLPKPNVVTWFGVLSFGFNILDVYSHSFVVMRGGDRSFIPTDCNEKTGECSCANVIPLREKLKYSDRMNLNSTTFHNLTGVYYNLLSTGLTTSCGVTGFSDEGEGPYCAPIQGNINVNPTSSSGISFSSNLFLPVTLLFGGYFSLANLYN